MAGRDPDDDDGAPAPPPAQRARQKDPVTVGGLEVGLLDVGRVVALNGYPEACRLLAFVSPSFYLERDLLMATKRVRYGRKQRTRLMSLSRAGDVERVSFLLLKAGADVNARDAQTMTALHWAGQNGHVAVVRLLLDGGADVGATGKDGFTPLHLASDKGHEAIVRLLLDKGARINATTTRRSTPLHFASLSGHEPVVRLLIDRGADVNAKAPHGTPLSLASNKGHEPVVRLLQAAGAEYRADLDTTSGRGWGSTCSIQ
jgi:ankyrin repeat protein